MDQQVPEEIEGVGEFKFLRKILICTNIRLTSN